MVTTLKDNMKGLQDGELEVEDKRCKNQHNIIHFDKRDTKAIEIHKGLVRTIDQLTSTTGKSICIRHMLPTMFHYHLFYYDLMRRHNMKLMHIKILQCSMRMGELTYKNRTIPIKRTTTFMFNRI